MYRVGIGNTRRQSVASCRDIGLPATTALIVNR